MPTELRCRECGRTAAESRTPVSRDAVEYTCARCLLGVQRVKMPVSGPRKHPTDSRCLLGGDHAPGSEWARDCPLDPERIARRRERAQKAAASRWGVPHTGSQRAAPDSSLSDAGAAR
jgi:hypothetical protein